MGAQDDILAGMSTFFVEMTEASSMLRYATPASLLLLDELGRGTATFDGCAIAVAVVNYLCHIGCRTLFSTHYALGPHLNLTDQRGIAAWQMATLQVDLDLDMDLDKDMDLTDSIARPIVFLYKFKKGTSLSYGLNVARLAGMPLPIVQKAAVASRRLHEATSNIEERRGKERQGEERQKGERCGGSGGSGTSTHSGGNGGSGGGACTVLDVRLEEARRKLLRQITAAAAQGDVSRVLRIWRLRQVGR